MLPRRRSAARPEVFLSVDPSSTSTGVCLWRYKFPELTVSYKPRSKNQAQRAVEIVYAIQMLGEKHEIAGVVCEQQINNPKRPAHVNLVLVQSIAGMCREQGWWYKRIHMATVRSQLDPGGSQRRVPYKEMIAEKVEHTFGISRFEKGDDELDAIGIGLAYMLRELKGG